MKVRHVGIVCIGNIENQIAFYKKMGFEPIYDQIEKVRIVKMKADGETLIELLQYESMSENTLRKAGISHIAFTQDSGGNNLEIVSVSPMARA